MNKGLSSGVPYTRHEVIGRGSYGIVYKGIHNVTKQAVAIKVLNLDTAEDEVSDIQKEIVLLQSLQAKDALNVVRYHGSFLHGTRLWIIMDYCEGGSIRTLMKCGKIEERYISIIIREVLAALNYIHKSDIIHRDIKAANILLTNDGRVQLADFGVAAQLAANHFKRNTFVGTPYWMAPEVISDGMSYNFKADIWSLGITIYEIATGNPPYADQEPMRAIFLIPRNGAPKLDGAVFSMAMKEFVNLCLSERSEDRPAAGDLLKTRWIKGNLKTSTSTLRELIARYDTWRKNGGVRKSLAMGGNMDGDDDFDEHFGLEDDQEADTNTWDFGTVKPGMAGEAQPTWEQSADAAEDLLKTIRPAGQQQAPNGSLSGATRHEHPLMRLFGPGNDSQGPPSGVQSMLDLPSRTNMTTEPSTPTNEAVVIEMPALGAVSLAAASSISLPSLPASANGAPGALASTQLKYGPRDVRGIGLVPSRQNSFDIFGPPSARIDPASTMTSSFLTSESPSQPKTEESANVSFPSSTEVIDTSSPAISMKAPSPTRSRPSSPTRIPLVNQMSPPASPSRSGIAPRLHSASTSISSTTSLAPKSGFAAGLGLTHMQLNGSAQSLPDILPRPSISGSSRERSPSTGSVPQLSKQHVKKPSNLILQMPGLADSLDSSFLPPSPSRALNGLALNINGSMAQQYVPTSLNQETNSALGGATTSNREIPRLLPNKRVTELPHLAPLDLQVLNDQDHNSVVSELTRVVGDMLVQLTHVENGLTGMTFNS